MNSSNSKGDGKRYFPLFVDLTDKRIVVVGAGTVATRRVRILTDFAGTIHVVASAVSHEILALADQGQITLDRKDFEEGDLFGADLVLAAADEKINDRVWTLCKEQGLPVNHAGDRSKCDFWFPAVIQTDEAIIGITASAGPGKARDVREQLESFLKTGNEEDEQ